MTLVHPNFYEADECLFYNSNCKHADKVVSIHVLRMHQKRIQSWYLKCPLTCFLNFSYDCIKTIPSTVLYICICDKNKVCIFNIMLKPITSLFTYNMYFIDSLFVNKFFYWYFSLKACWYEERWVSCNVCLYVNNELPFSGSD